MTRRMESEIDPTLLMISAHELGHAVVWHASGLHVKIVQARTGLFGSSYALLDLAKTTWTPATGRAYLVGLLAGPQAGMYWCEVIGQCRYNERHDAGDMEQFYRYRRANKGAKAIPERVLRGEARTAVRKHWERIERLVPQLASRGSLSRQSL